MKITILSLLYCLWISNLFGQKATTVNLKNHHQIATSQEGEKIFKQLLLAFSYNADSVIHLFDKNSVIEFPYAVSLKTAERLNYNEYYNYLKKGLPNMPNIKFKNAIIYPTINNAFWAEAHGEVTIPSTNKLYKQKYVMYFIIDKGKISHYREYWDPIEGIKAFGNENNLNEIFNKK